MPTPCIADTNCIHLALSGVPATLSASPIIENTVTGGNNLQCTAAGLLDRIDSGLALPGAPKSRDEFYAGTSEGPLWHLRYVSGLNVWQFLGGAALFDEVRTSQDSQDTGSTFVNLATIGPQVTVDFDGTYAASFGALVTLPRPVPGETTTCRIGLKVGAGGITQIAESSWITAAGGGLDNSVEYQRSLSVAASCRFTAAAGDILLVKYEVVLPTVQHPGGTFERRWLSVLPVSVT